MREADPLSMTPACAVAVPQGPPTTRAPAHHHVASANASPRDACHNNYGTRVPQQLWHALRQPSTNTHTHTHTHTPRARRVHKRGNAAPWGHAC
jgi:hypothetical protein